VATRSPVIGFSVRSQRFVQTIKGSETLKARARAIRDEFTQVVTLALSESVGREPTDPDARLAAGLLLATWTVAFMQAHRTFRQKRDRAKAEAAFLAIVDKGSIGLKAAMARTPYGRAIISGPTIERESAPLSRPLRIRRAQDRVARDGGVRIPKRKKGRLNEQAAQV
jgi:hypothetical protein